MVFEFYENTPHSDSILQLKDRVFGISIETGKSKFCWRGSVFSMYDSLISMKNSAFLADDKMMRDFAGIAIDILENIISNN